MNPFAIKLAIEAAIALALFGGGGYLAWKHQAAKLHAAEVTIEAQTTTITNLLAVQKRNNAAIALGDRLRSEATAASKRARDDLAAALLANHDWASQQVPQEVQRVLP